MKLSADLKAFESRIGYHFTKPELLTREMLSGGRRKQALLGDAIEAIIAAVYMDAGFSAAKDLILRLWSDRIHTVKQDARDAKTALQEWAQARGFPPPAYVQTDRQGPDHAPLFTIRLALSP